MKRIYVLLVMMGLAVEGSGQTVTGSGGTGSIPEFKSSTTIGNSPIFDLNGNVGIGTMTPGFPFHVLAGAGGPAQRLNAGKRKYRKPNNYSDSSLHSQIRQSAQRLTRV